MFWVRSCGGTRSLEVGKGPAGDSGCVRSANNNSPPHSEPPLVRTPSPGPFCVGFACSPRLRVFPLTVQNQANEVVGGTRNHLELFPEVLSTC